MNWQFWWVFRTFLRKLVNLKNGWEFLKHLDFALTLVYVYNALFSSDFPPGYCSLNSLFFRGFLKIKKNLFCENMYSSTFLQVVDALLFSWSKMLVCFFPSACFKLDGLCIDCLHQSKSFDFIFWYSWLYVSKSVTAAPFDMANTTMGP